ncbi:MAG: GxxExxY protein [Bacteroidetes bacterium]|nr:GxxExxY protein [Bacteroidota bacterium]MBK8586374.1 GxxExxY protein [Bacteroidota bacterium]
MVTKNNVNEIAYGIMGCAIEVNKFLGPGLLESVYQECMINELKRRGYNLEIEQNVPLYYKGDKISNKLRLDLIVNDLVIVELKAVEALNPIFTSQILTYMKLAQKPKGLLINFNSKNIVSGSLTFVNEFFASLPE